MARPAASTALLLILILSGPAAWAHLASHAPLPCGDAPLVVTTGGAATGAQEDAGECPVCLGRTAPSALLSPTDSGMPEEPRADALSTAHRTAFATALQLTAAPRGPPSHA